MSKYRITVDGMTYEMDVELIGEGGAVKAAKPAAAAASAAPASVNPRLLYQLPLFPHPQPPHHPQRLLLRQVQAPLSLQCPERLSGSIKKSAMK